MSNRTKILIASLAFFIISIILIFSLPKTQVTLINVLSICGFLLSMLGIYISYIQIISIKKIAVQTQKEIEEHVRLNNNLLMLSDLSRKAAMVDEIQTYLRDDKIEMCILRMKDLKIILNSIKNQEYYISLVSKKEFRGIFENFNLDLDNFQTHNLDKKIKIDKSIIMKHLEDLSTLFLSVEIKLKNHKNDS